VRDDYEILTSGRFRNGTLANPAYRIPGWNKWKMRREKMKIKKICIVCGKNPAINGLTRCEKCRKHKNEWNTRKRKDAAKNHICVRCLKPLSPELIEKVMRAHHKLNGRCA
jgi:hypothetical protein